MKQLTKEASKNYSNIRLEKADVVGILSKLEHTVNCTLSIEIGSYSIETYKELDIIEDPTAMNLFIYARFEEDGGDTASLTLRLTPALAYLSLNGYDNEHALGHYHRIDDILSKKQTRLLTRKCLIVYVCIILSATIVGVLTIPILAFRHSWFLGLLAILLIVAVTWLVPFYSIFYYIFYRHSLIYLKPRPASFWKRNTDTILVSIITSLISMVITGIGGYSWGYSAGEKNRQSIQSTTQPTTAPATKPTK